MSHGKNENQFFETTGFDCRHLMDAIIRYRDQARRSLYWAW